MAATFWQIEAWVRGAEPETTHVAIVCDTYDHTDYPVEIVALDESDCRRQVEEKSTGNMRQLMEVYSLTGKHDISAQLAERRAYHYD